MVRMQFHSSSTLWVSTNLHRIIWCKGGRCTAPFLEARRNPRLIFLPKIISLLSSPLSSSVLILTSSSSLLFQIKRTVRSHTLPSDSPLYTSYYVSLYNYFSKLYNLNVVSRYSELLIIKQQ